jgi:hypothetical protein
LYAIAVPPFPIYVIISYHIYIILSIRDFGTVPVYALLSPQKGIS